MKRSIRRIALWISGILGLAGVTACSVGAYSEPNKAGLALIGVLMAFLSVAIYGYILPTRRL